VNGWRTAGVAVAGIALVLVVVLPLLGVVLLWYWSLAE
jgi:hypothetical protein